MWLKPERRSKSESNRARGQLNSGDRIRASRQQMFAELFLSSFFILSENIGRKPGQKTKGAQAPAEEK